MRRFIPVCLALLMLAADARSGIIEKEIAFARPRIVNNGGTVSIAIEGCRNIGAPGTPALPVYAACFAIPRGEVIVSVEVVPAGETSVMSLPGEPRCVSRQAPPGRNLPAPARDEAFWSRTAPYPDLPGELGTVQSAGGIDLAWVNLHPCRYVPSTGMLLYTGRLRVSIVTGAGRPLADPRAGRALTGTARRLLDGVENPADLNGLETSPASASDQVPYLIITSEALAPAFEQLSELKNLTGLETMTATVEDIAAAMPGTDLQEKIRNYIIYAYEQLGTQYVMLGGDVDIVPARSFYVKAGSEIEPDIPSDLYYGALDGNWNSDGDSYFGEPGEEDLLPEVVVGRLPADTPADVAAYCDKLERYTISPSPASCATSLMLGELLWDDIVATWGGDYKDEILFGTDNYGYTTAGIPAGFQNWTLYDRDLGGWTSSDLLAVLNAGVNLVNHLGHSNVHMVMNLPIWEVGGLTGGGPGWIPFVCYSQGCYPAAIDNRDETGNVYPEDSIGEQLVNAPWGAVAFIGNTRLGWGAPGSTSSVSQYYDRQFFDAIFAEDEVIIGEAFDDSRIDNIPFIDYAVFRYVMYEMCLLGDPAMPVWRGEPSTLTVECDTILCCGQALHQVRVSSGEDPVEGARISLRCEDPAFYRTCLTDASGTAYIEDLPDCEASALLSVWAADHFLYTDSLGITVDCDARLAFLQISVDDDSLGDSIGDGDGTIDGGEKVEFDLVVKNTGSTTAFGTVLAASSSSPFVTIYDDTVALGDIPPRTALILDDAVTVELAESVPDGSPLLFDFALISEGRHWSTREVVDIHAPGQMLISWSVTDTIAGNGNGCLEGWEFLDISTTWFNNGSVDIIDPAVRLSVTPQGWVRIIKGTEQLPDIPAGTAVSSSGGLQVFVRESTPPFTEIEIGAVLEGANIVPEAETLRFTTCGTAIQDDASSEGAWTHEAVTGYDGWHITTEDGASSPGAWKCGGQAGDSYPNMMDAVLVSPPLCLHDNSVLTFAHRMEAEATTSYPYWAQDAGVVEISADAGLSWQIVDPTVYYPCRAASTNTIFLDAYQRCYSGSMPWQTAVFDLSAWHGPVLLRFRFATNEQISFTGWFIDDIEVTTEIVTGGDTPVPAGADALVSVSPNPFNPSTRIEFELASRSRVEFSVYDVAGRRIRRLIDEVRGPGLQALTWDGKDDRGRSVASGVYFLRMTTGLYTASTRLVLMR